jgi:hypothetical protein
MVSAVDKLRDQTVRSVMERTFTARDALTAFKALVREEDSDVSEPLCGTA